MAYIKNFKKEETRHIENSGNGITSNYDAWDNPTVKATNTAQETFFTEHIQQYTEFISWAR